MPVPFYDPEKSYEENFKKGPFGSFSGGVVMENKGEPKFFHLLALRPGH